MSKIIYKAIFGSKCYGTADENSDTDIRGIFLPTIKECLGFDRKDEKRINDDEVYFSIHKFFKLAIENNPSVFEWMWIPENLILEATEDYIPILENREAFLSKPLFYKFKGYAMSEFEEMTKITGTTGSKRRAIIYRYGYDTKKAMNCIRLLDQAIELLRFKTIVFPRPNVDELMEIKYGKMIYKHVLSLFRRKMQDLENAYLISTLPTKADTKFLKNLMVNIILNQNDKKN